MIVNDSWFVIWASVEFRRFSQQHVVNACRSLEFQPSALMAIYELSNSCVEPSGQHQDAVPPECKRGEAKLGFEYLKVGEVSTSSACLGIDRWDGHSGGKAFS